MKKIIHVKVFKDEDGFVDWQKAGDRQIICIQVIPHQATAVGDDKSCEVKLITNIVVQYWEFEEEKNGN